MDNLKNKYQLEGDGLIFERSKLVNKERSTIADDKALLQPKIKNQRELRTLLRSREQQINNLFRNLANDITEIKLTLEQVASGRAKVELAMLRDQNVKGYDSSHAKAVTSIRKRVIPAWELLLKIVQSPRP
ncbi:hypothetical protein TWF694_010112 [Orbilia ellipsospora]|uniref:Uncharacterized protein n=1 Tax=Orbilia ellipsospora TaxID=2528407 RepID=A0AAV9XF89_9PEZI